MKVSIVLEFDIAEGDVSGLRASLRSDIDVWKPVFDATELISLYVPQLVMPYPRRPKIHFNAACEDLVSRFGAKLPLPFHGISGALPPAKFPVLTLNCLGKRRYWAVQRRKEDWDGWQHSIVGWWPMADPDEHFEGVDHSRQVEAI